MSDWHFTVFLFMAQVRKITSGLAPLEGCRRPICGASPRHKIGPAPRSARKEQHSEAGGRLSHRPEGGGGPDGTLHYGFVMPAKIRRESRTLLIIGRFLLLLLS